jgi:hypothetical protein
MTKTTELSTPAVIAALLVLLALYAIAGLAFQPPPGERADCAPDRLSAFYERLPLCGG